MPFGQLFGHELGRFALHLLRLEVHLAFGFAQLGFFLCGELFLVAGKLQFVGDERCLNRCADFLGNKNIAYQRPSQGNVFADQDFLDIGDGGLLELLSFFPTSKSDRLVFEPLLRPIDSTRGTSTLCSTAINVTKFDNNFGGMLGATHPRRP